MNGPRDKSKHEQQLCASGIFSIAIITAWKNGQNHVGVCLGEMRQKKCGPPRVRPKLYDTENYREAFEFDSGDEFQPHLFVKFQNSRKVALINNLSNEGLTYHA
ncbi:hypothetical protein EAF04_000807 [Stromatinia cepivora]|nr:hypothetical protein EAF04_000807 [Stromatinia cepivora]